MFRIAFQVVCGDSAETPSRSIVSLCVRGCGVTLSSADQLLVAVRRKMSSSPIYRFRYLADSHFSAVFELLVSILYVPTTLCRDSASSRRAGPKSIYYATQYNHDIFTPTPCSLHRAAHCTMRDCCSDGTSLVCQYIESDNGVTLLSQGLVVSSKDFSTRTTQVRGIVAPQSGRTTWLSYRAPTASVETLQQILQEMDTQIDQLQTKIAEATQAAKDNTASNQRGA